MAEIDLLNSVQGIQQPLDVLLTLLTLAVIIAFVIQALLDIGGRRLINKRHVKVWLRDRLKDLSDPFSEQKTQHSNFRKAEEKVSKLETERNYFVEQRARKVAEQRSGETSILDRPAPPSLADRAKEEAIYKKELKKMDEGLEAARKSRDDRASSFEGLPHPLVDPDVTLDDALSILLGQSKRVLHLRPGQVVGRIATGTEALIDPDVLTEKRGDALKRRTALAIMACQDAPSVSQFAEYLAKLSGEDADAARYGLLQMIESGIDDLQVKVLQAWICWQYGLAVGFSAIGVVLLYRFLPTEAALDFTIVVVLIAPAIATGVVAVPVRVALERWFTSIGTQ